MKLRHSIRTAVLTGALLALVGGTGFAAQVTDTMVQNPETDNGLTLTENGFDWNQVQYINVFNNSGNNAEKIIAPGDFGTCDFSVTNTTGYDLQYTMKVSEVNKFEIPIVCRLRSGDQYLLGGEEQWMSLKQFYEMTGTMQIDQSNTYTFDWKWNTISDEADTRLGMEAADKEITYTLFFEVNASQRFASAPQTGDVQNMAAFVMTGAFFAGALTLLVKRIGKDKVQ